MKIVDKFCEIQKNFNKILYKFWKKLQMFLKKFYEMFIENVQEILKKFF